jgi:hypothetical protein
LLYRFCNQRIQRPDIELINREATHHHYRRMEDSTEYIKVYDLYLVSTRPRDKRIDFYTGDG